MYIFSFTTSKKTSLQFFLLFTGILFQSFIYYYFLGVYYSGKIFNALLSSVITLLSNAVIVYAGMSEWRFMFLFA